MIGNSKRKKKMYRILIPVLVAALAVVFIFVWQRGRQRVRQRGIVGEESSQQTEEVIIQDLTKSIGATGKVVSKKSRELSVSLTDTEVTKVYVEEGAVVKKGEKLMAFDVSESEQNLSDAKTALSNAKEKNSISESDASRSVSYAETTRDQQIASAKKAKQKAYSTWQDAKKDYEDARDSLKEAKDEEKKAKTAYEETKTQDTKAAYEAAVTKRSGQEQAVETAKQQKKTAKETYETQCSAYEQTLTAQDNSVSTAKSNEKSVKISGDTSSQEAQIRQYQKQVDKGVITAPYDGIITSVNYEKGETYNGGTALVIQDCSAFEVETEIGEYDISQVETGQKVLMKTDATGEEELTGKVTYIAVASSSGDSGSGSGSSANAGTSEMTSAGSSMSGSEDINYTVRISFDESVDSLKLDMSASISILLEQHENVMTVPYNAVQTKEDGTNETGTAYVTRIDDNGGKTDIPVEIVMESNYYTEIASEDLKEGDQVLIVEEENTDTGMSFGPEAGGMPGGGF